MLKVHFKISAVLDFQTFDFFYSVIHFKFSLLICLYSPNSDFCTQLTSKHFELSQNAVSVSQANTSVSAWSLHLRKVMSEAIRNALNNVGN